MRLHTEAFDYSPVPAAVIVIGLLLLLAMCAAYYFLGEGKRKRVLLDAVQVTSALCLILFVINLVTYGINREELDRDLKDQLGIEKVSYGDKYRQLTGEKDGKVVFCVFAEEGDRGNIYEVICR